METETLTLPLLPLKSAVVMPGMVFTLALESDEARAAVSAARESGGRIVIVPYVDERYSRVGVVADVADQGELPGGREAALVSGEHRALVRTGVPGTGDALWVEVEIVEEPSADRAARELAREFRAVLQNILVGRGGARIAASLREVVEPARLADMAGYLPDLTLAQKVQVLETLDLVERLRLVLSWAREALADLNLQERIKADVEEGMERTQREFLLRRQLDAIRKELGELGDGREPAPRDYRARISESQLPDHVKSAVEREIGRLERMSEQSPESGWIQTWIDTVLELPWGVRSEDRLEIKEAAQVLDNDHEGLADVKDRILEHLAVRKLRAERGLGDTGPRGAGAMIALVGPPGVGKTSLGESVARALGRRFVRVALGGIRDEAEIRGHRRTYVGAQPGRLVRALREAGTMNPVVVLDEIDKLGNDYRGDPAAAFLEVLDPAQNHTFRDNYLEVELDLSDVLFIATANVADSIPAPLLDRMEIVRLDGYTQEEKVTIARHHLLERQLERAALRPDEVHVTDDAIRAVIADHTRESGVRSLERELGRTLRKIARRLAAADLIAPVVVDAGSVSNWLGRPKFLSEQAPHTAVPGVVTGLAVTGTGGDVLQVEASVADGPFGLTLTGQLGDVMRESAEIALSLVRSHASSFGIDPRAFDGKHFHLHVPAGAVPKDGPSAGVTMASALVSLLRDAPARAMVAMTGELTLQGRVLPIGGVRQKVLAAHRAGLTEVVLPAQNGPDLEDVPEEVRKEMTFHLADHIQEVLRAAVFGNEALVTPDRRSSAGAQARSDETGGLPAVA